jgi:hypothetical protein
MLFNTTFNNISVILWQQVLLMEESGENHWPVAGHWQTVSHNVVSSTTCWAGFQLTPLVVIGTDCIGSYISNYHMIMTMTPPNMRFCQQTNIGSRLWCLSQHSTIFPLYRGSQYYWRRKPQTCRKSLTNLITCSMYSW